MTSSIKAFLVAHITKTLVRFVWFFTYLHFHLPTLLKSTFCSRLILHFTVAEPIKGFVMTYLSVLQLHQHVRKLVTHRVCHSSDKIKFYRLMQSSDDRNQAGISRGIISHSDTSKTCFDIQCEWKMIIERSINMSVKPYRCFLSHLCVIVCVSQRFPADILILCSIVSSHDKNSPDAFWETKTTPAVQNLSPSDWLCFPSSHTHPVTPYAFIPGAQQTEAHLSHTTSSFVCE